MSAMTLTPAERQARYRAKQKAAGKSTHPERARRRAQGLPARPERHSLPWCFIDTEGANDPDGRFGDPGRQYTYLICAASDDGFERSLYRDRPLTTREMISFVIGLPGPRKHKFGGYFFGYDRDQILHNVPAERLRRLYGTAQTGGAPIRIGAYIASLFNTQTTFLLPKDRALEDPDDINEISGIRRVIWDVGRFYQARFTKALENWQIATDEELAELDSMKTDRESFDLDYWAAEHERIIRYSLMENRLAARLQGKFDRTCADLGYPLTSWYGAGSMAKSLMNVRRVREHLDGRRPIRRYKNLGHDFATQLPYTYFGGRFEIREPGEFAPIYEYDLRSAYPASYRTLPCLQHGEWRYTRSLDPPELPQGRHDLYAVSWDIPAAHYFGPFPQRHENGTICYPQRGSGNVWGEELAAALKIWPRNKPGKTTGITLHERWQYRRGCGCHPFDWIDEVYQQRRELGKDTAGFPLKLGMNAIYGSLASVLGSTFEENAISGWWEPRWAAMITAWTRARLLDALRLAGGPRSDSPIMFATDAIYTTRPIENLDLTDRLGGWEAHEFPDGGLLIQPGVYHLRGQTENAKLKGRGIKFADMQANISRFYDQWHADGIGAEVTIPLSPRYQGVRLSLHRGDIGKAHRWIQRDMTLSYQPGHKRQLRSGKWKPPDRRDENPWEPSRWGAPARKFRALILGLPLPQPIAGDIEQLEEQWQADAQPAGPMAREPSGPPA